MKLLYLSPYPTDDLYKQRFHHILPYLREGMDDIIVVSAIHSSLFKRVAAFLVSKKVNKSDSCEGKGAIEIGSLPVRLLLNNKIFECINYYLIRSTIKKSSQIISRILLVWVILIYTRSL